MPGQWETPNLIWGEAELNAFAMQAAQQHIIVSLTGEMEKFCAQTCDRGGRCRNPFGGDCSIGGAPTDESWLGLAVA